jgi:SAM-dependent methyltransferase
VDYIRDWSPVPASRYAQAQRREAEWWRESDPALLTRTAEYHFYAGYYEWTKHGGLLNPFRVDPSRVQNFHLPAAAVEGKAILDVGCGPISQTMSLVHCAEVHVVDPLVDLFREIQPFGWEFFTSVSSEPAEQLPFDDHRFHFVHCRNVLDHTRDAESILRETARVLVPQGQLLLGCDVRGAPGGGKAHPYNWTIDAFEERVFEHFEPVTPVALIDEADGRRPVPRDQARLKNVVFWVARLRKKE